MKKLFIFCCFFLLTGCWNYQELNEYAIVTGMAVDIKDNKYEVSFLIANGNKSEQEQTKTSLISGEGETIYNAIKDISLSSPKELYVSHLSVVIISEEVASKGISNLLDYLLREPQSHQNFYLLISKDTNASNILSILSPLSDYPSQNIASNISNTSKLQGKISDASFNVFIQKYLNTGFEPIMNSITIIGNVKEGQSAESQDKTKQDAYTKLDTLALFNKDKFITAGNPNNRQVSFIIVDNEEITNYFDEIKLDYDKVSTKYQETSSHVEMINGAYDKTEFNELNSKLKNSPKLCLKDLSNLSLCEKNSYYLLNPSKALTSSNLIEVKNSIRPGSIILISSGVTKENIKYILNEIEYKDLDIVHISKLINEKGSR